MLDNIPFEIQVEIAQRIPDVKSLIQFRSVSKPWKSLIDSSEFIADYHTRHRNHRLLLRYYCWLKYVSIVDDDDTFPQHEISVPMYVTGGVYASTSQGLIFFYNFYEKSVSDSSGTKTVLLWNPAVRKSVEIVVPNYVPYKTVIGFGVSPHTNDPMLVKIMNRENTTSRRVEVFTLSTGVWRSCLSANRHLPRNSIEFLQHHVAVDRFIYWVGIDDDAEQGQQQRQMIMSFDMISEEFTEISLPRFHNGYDVDMFKLRESLVVSERNPCYAEIEHDVWILEDGVPKSFTKLFSIKAPDASIGRVLGFRRSGEPIVRRRIGYIYVTCVYDPCSQRVNDIAISDDDRYLDFVTSYTETLLLLDHH